MSGIVGIINLDRSPVERDLLEQMTSHMAFRGPDAQGIWLSEDTNGQPGHIGLGHALLRTTFEAEHEQGPCTLDGRVWITADARVDDRPQLVQELRAGGRELLNDIPDPELILHAYLAWGEECVGRLIGDFAFVIWDGRDERLFCARDQFGVVPFYYANVGDCLVISNTLNTIRLHPVVSDRLNEMAIGDFLLFGGNQDPGTTTFADILRLPPAHTLSWSGDSLNTQRYWTLPEGNSYIRYKNPADYVDRFRETLRLTISDRMRTDRVAVSMSGGLDSTSVAAISHDILSKSGRPFAFCAYTQVFDRLITHEERHYAGLVAAKLGFPIHYLVAEDYRLTAPPEKPERVRPEPDSNWQSGRQPEVLLRGATTGRIILTGQGGDPALRPSRSYWIDLLKKLQLGRFLADVRDYRHRYGRRPPFYLRANLRHWLGTPQRQQPFPTWINPSFASRLDLPSRWEWYARNTKPAFGRRSMASYPAWQNLFTIYDPGVTYVPVKARFPFFDIRLVSYLLSVPPVPWFEKKRLLRAAMCGILPESVRQRPKTPLAANPTHALALQQGCPVWMEALAAAPELAEYADLDTLLQLLRSPEPGEGAEYRSTRRPLALGYWLQHVTRCGRMNVYTPAKSV